MDLYYRRLSFVYIKIEGSFKKKIFIYITRACVFINRGLILDVDIKRKYSRCHLDEMNDFREIKRRLSRFSRHVLIDILALFVLR